MSGWINDNHYINMKKILVTTLFIGAVVAVRAQEKRVFTSEDYARAESMVGYNTGPLIDRAEVRPMWIEGDRFWYRVSTATGSEFVLVDPAKKTRTVYATRDQLATAVQAVTGKPLDASHMGGSGRRGGGSSVVVSPDGKRAAFIRDYNLWVRDLATKQETQLTTDGEKD